MNFPLDARPRLEPEMHRRTLARRSSHRAPDTIREILQVGMLTFFVRL